jgi:hypothetical protein
MGSYAPPTIGSAGLTIPTYQEILALFTQAFLAIYGQNYYLGNDSPAYELLSVLALADSDAMNGLQLAYNNMSPATATGAGLSLLVLLNGLARLPASNSTCTVTLTGFPGALVTNGVIQNSATGDLWNLPSVVTIGPGGTISVTATAQQSGPVNANASQLTVIVTPTGGWTSVTNGSNLPSLGVATETDSALRQRQAASVELPSQTLLDGTYAAILATPGVSRATVLENDGATSDSLGNPGHSISAVVQGGTNAAVAQAIYANRGLGVLTNGSTGGTLVTVNVTSPTSGIVTAINFATPQLVTIYVSLDVHLYTGASAGVVGPAIQAALVAYINALPLATPGSATTTQLCVISFGELVAAANSPNVPGPATYSVRAASFFFGTSSSPSTNTDIQLSFYQAAQSATGDIVITYV